VYPIACKNKSLEEGDKILLPPSALDQLARMKVNWPMMFKIANPQTGKTTHCGVMEFSSEEGVAYLPYWMMQNLLVEDGGFVNLVNVTLQKVQFPPPRAGGSRAHPRAGQVRQAAASPNGFHRPVQPAGGARKGLAQLCLVDARRHHHGEIW
jgi:hypothetical protein